jgi:hypothetical protein
MAMHRFAVLLLFALPALAADPVPVVDRGLPQANLNDISGEGRSNVRWTWNDNGLLGDEFVLGAPGESWVIDAIRVWSVPGVDGKDPAHLGDYYQDVRLYFGDPGSDLTPVVTARLAPGSDATGSAQVRVSDATAAGALLYDDFGASLKIWQVDFVNLNLPAEGGARYRFGAWGLGRPLPGGPHHEEYKTYAWFNHASHAPLSSARQDGADGSMLLIDAAGRIQGPFNGEGAGWNKSSDINVQVFARRLN